MGKWCPRGGLAAHGLEHSAGNADVGVGRNHVDVVRLDARSLADLVDGHGGGAGEKPGEHALMPGFQVLDVNESHSGVR